MKILHSLLSLCAVSLMLAACSNPAKQNASRPDGIVLNLELTGLPDSTELQFSKAFFATVDSTFRATIKASSDSWWGAMLVLYSYSYVNENNAE